jgi:hypothetical protein
MLGAGLSVEHPEPHLLFSHYFYGLILVGVTPIFGPLGHGVLLFFAIWVSIVIDLMSTVTDSISNTLNFFRTLGVISCVFAAVVLRPTFTTVSAILCGITTLAFIVCLASRRQPIGMWFAISFFLGLSFIIRPESFLLGLVVTGPLLFWLLWFGSEIEKVNAKCYFVIVVVIASLGYLSDWAIYQSSPAWREAVEYKQLWKIFIDFNRVPWIDDSPVYQSVGWSHNDYQMFKSWYSLNDIYNKNNLQLLVKELSIPVTVVDFHQISRWFESAWTEPVVRFILGAQLLFWTVLRRRSLGILIVIGQCLAIVLVAQTGRVPLLRIWFSIAAVGLLAFATLPMSISGYWRGTLSTVVLVSITLISVWAITYHVTEVIKIQASASQYQKLIGKTSVLLQGKAVVWADALKYELLITPFHVYKPFPELFVLGIDSSSHTPVMASAMEHFHISDFGLWLCRGEADIPQMSCGTGRR